MPDFLIMMFIIAGAIGSFVMLLMLKDDDVPLPVAGLVWIATAFMIVWFCRGISTMEAKATKEYTMQSTKDGSVQFIQVEDVLINMNKQFSRILPEGTVIQIKKYNGTWSWGMYHVMVSDEILIKEPRK